jgi:hypothetical protein
MPEALKASPTIAKERFDEFLSQMLEAQARAESPAGGALRRRFRIAGNDIELRLAHPALGDLFCKALAHLEIAARDEPNFTFHIWDEASSGIGAPAACWPRMNEPNFTFHIWDEASSGIPPPPPCWSEKELLGHGEITGLIDAERYLQVVADKSIIAAHRLSRKAAVWLRSPGDVEEWERAAPLLAPINWWASGFGYFNVHAASVGRPDGGVLIVGPGGVGKSHTAIACLDSDLFYVSDDHCLLGTGGRPSTASVYSTAKVFAYDLPRFPLLQQRENEAFRTQEDKAVFYLNEIVPDRLSSGFPIRAVLLPRPSGRRDTQIMRAPASAALLYLGPDNVLRWPSVGRIAFGRFASALRSLPCFRLEVGSDLSQIPKTIASLLDTVQAPELA